MLCKICVKRAINGSLPGGCSFFWQQKKEPKKTAAVSTQRTRDLGAARPQDPQRGSRKGRGLLLFVLNAPAPSSTLNSGVPPNPRCRKQQSVGAGHARPAALLCHPFAFCIVGRGLDPSAASRRREPQKPLRPSLPLGLRGFAAQSTPNSSPLTPPPPLSLSQNFTNFTRSTQNLPPLCKTFTAIVPYYGRNRRKTAVQLACFR